MLSQPGLQRRRTVLFAVTVFFLLTIISYRFAPQDRIDDYFLQTPATGSAEASPPSLDVLDIIPEYNVARHDTPFCAERFGLKYLERLRDSATGYCTPNSASNLTCFHIQRSPDSAYDMFCVGKSAFYDFTDQKFTLGCQPIGFTQNESSDGIPDLKKLQTYWYNTGPRPIFDQAIQMDTEIEVANSTPNITILIKREGAFNLWHCLIEIWSMTMTIDVLRTAFEPGQNSPFLTADDAINTQVVILDEHENGPYFDLWTLFAKRPVIRLNDISESTNFENVIVPLAGASNPIWEGDWEPHGCERFELLRTFAHRVLDFYQLNTLAPHSEDLVVTFIDRKDTRRLVDHEAYLEELKAKVPHVKVQIIDFATIPLAEQLRIIRETDILVGVHGAGLTHGMFLRAGSVMVEILPGDLNHKGFRNLAGLLGHTYLSTHGSKPSETETETNSKRDGWHGEDVFLEKNRFLELMDVAVKILYNKGLRNYDVN